MFAKLSGIISIISIGLQLLSEWRKNSAGFEKSFYEFLKGYSKARPADAKPKWDSMMSRLKERTKDQVAP